MLAKRIIPCLDTRNGRLVKGVRFADLVNHGDPAQAAGRYYLDGADEICLLDISATQEGRLALEKVVNAVAGVISVPLSVGGGIRSLEDIQRLTMAGADKLSLNTAAVEDPDLISRAARLVGSQSVVIAVDAKRVGTGFRVFTRAGTHQTQLEPCQWAKQAEALGAGEVLLTSIDADGTNQGFDVELIARVRRAVDLPIIASGGAGSLEDFWDAFNAGADAALAASLFHRGKMTVAQVKAYLREKGVMVR